MKKLVCGLLASMLLSGTAAALEPISQPIATSGYTYYAIRADGALLAWGDSFHGAVGPADQDPLPWEEANVLLEDARYVDAGFVMAAAIDEEGTLWGWGGTHNGRAFGEEEPYRLLEDVVSVSVMDSMCAALRTDGAVWTWGPRSGKSLAAHQDDPFYPPTQVLDHTVQLHGDLAVLEDGTLVQVLMDGEIATIRPLMEHVADVCENGGFDDDAMLVQALDGSLWRVPCTTAEEEASGLQVYVLEQPEKLLEEVSHFSPGLAVTADGTLWAWGHQRPAMLRDGRVDPEDPYGWRHYDDVVKITDGVISAVACSDRTLAVLEDGSLWQLPSAGFLPEWEESPDRSPAVPEKLLDQVRMPSPAPAFAADAPAPAVVESASLEVWEAQQEETEAEPEAQVPQPVPEPPAEAERPEQSSAAGLVTAALSAAVLALLGWLRGKRQ